MIFNFVKIFRDVYSEHETNQSKCLVMIQTQLCKIDLSKINKTALSANKYFVDVLQALLARLFTCMFRWEIYV